MKFFSLNLVFAGGFTTFTSGCFLIYSKNASGVDLIMTATLFTKIMDIAGHIAHIVHVIADLE